VARPREGLLAIALRPVHLRGVRSIPDRLRTAEQPTLLVEGETGAPKRVAFLSGSFDPLTLGHTTMAEAAAERADLVVLIYSVRTLPKEGDTVPPLLSEEERLDIISTWCEGHPGIVPGVCSHGLLANQADAVRGCFPGARSLIVLGSDKALQLLDPKWYDDRNSELGALFKQSDVLYAERSGEEGAVDAELALRENSRWRKHFVRIDIPATVASISARKVRTLVAKGKRFEKLLPKESADALS